MARDSSKKDCNFLIFVVYFSLTCWTGVPPRRVSSAESCPRLWNGGVQVASDPLIQQFRITCFRLVNVYVYVE